MTTTPTPTRAIARDPRTEALRELESFEKRHHYDAAYMRHMLEENPEAYAVFSHFIPMASHRKHAPLEAFCVARIAAFQQHDCGACLQLAIRKAREEGVSVELIRRTLDGGAGLPEPLARVRRMVGAMADNAPEMDALREQIRADFGEPAWIEMAACIAAAAVFPTIKKALGYFQSCALARIEV